MATITPATRAPSVWKRNLTDAVGVDCGTTCIGGSGWLLAMIELLHDREDMRNFIPIGLLFSFSQICIRCFYLTSPSLCQIKRNSNRTIFIPFTHVKEILHPMRPTRMRFI